MCENCINSVQKRYTKVDRHVHNLSEQFKREGSCLAVKKKKNGTMFFIMFKGVPTHTFEVVETVPHASHMQTNDT